MILDLPKDKMARLLHDAWVSADGLVDAYSHMKSDPQYAKNVQWRDYIEALHSKLFGRSLR